MASCAACGILVPPKEVPHLVPLGIKMFPEDFVVVEIDPDGNRVDGEQYAHPPPSVPHEEAVKDFSLSPIPIAEGPKASCCIAGTAPVRSLLSEDLFADLLAYANGSPSDEPFVLGDVPYLDKQERGTLRVSIRNEFPLLNTKYSSADGSLSVYRDADVAVLVRCIGQPFAERLVRLSLPAERDNCSVASLTASYCDDVSAEDRRQFHSSVQRVCPFLKCRVEHGQLSFSRAPAKRAREATGHDISAPAVPMVFTHCVAVKRNVDALSLVAIVARHFQLGDGHIGVCGMKDRCAVTYQRISIRGDLSAAQTKWPLTVLQDDGSSITLLGPPVIRQQPLAVGALAGNAFRIVLRPPSVETDRGTFDEMVRLVAERVKCVEQRGFPNFFGLQRFSRVKSMERHPGCLILARRWADAVDALLDTPEEDTVATTSVVDWRRTPEQARAILYATSNADEASDGLSTAGFRDACTVLGALRRVIPAASRGNAVDVASKEWNDTCREAFEHVPFCLKQLWLHSAQSLIFNTLLSRHLLGGGGASKDPQTRLMLPLVGTNTIGPAVLSMPSLLPDVLSGLGLSVESFTAAKTFAGVPLRGGWRDAFVFPRRVDVSAATPADAGICVSFELPSSAYATVFLHEVLGYMPRDLV